MTFDPAQLQVEGEPQRRRRCRRAGAGQQTSSGRGRRPPVVNAAGDPDLAVPAGQRARYEAAFARFCRVFPDMFYMRSAAGNYFDTDQGSRAASSSAGFHNLMGYFRDDQPLYELMLDDAQQKQLDALWRELDFVAAVTSRMYIAVLLENQTSQGGGRGRRRPLPPNRRTAIAVTAEPTHQGDRGGVPGRGADGGDDRGDRGDRAIYFDCVNDRHPLGRAGPRARPSRSTSTRC